MYNSTGGTAYTSSAITRYNDDLATLMFVKQNQEGFKQFTYPNAGLR